VEATQPLTLPGSARPLAGLLLLGLAGAAARPEVAVVLAALPLGLTIAAGVMSAPLLFVLHQTLGLAASPGRMLSALGEGLRAAGSLAGGLAPVVLFFALTSMRGGQAMALGLAWSGWAGLRAARGALCRVEAAAGGERTVAVAALAEAWCTLCAALGLRLAWLAWHGLPTT